VTGRAELSAAERELVCALQDGLPLTRRPFEALAERIGWTEEQVIRRLKGWVDDGSIRRFGVVVRHRELGIRHNAMVVWDIPDQEVAAIGRQMTRRSYVTLCYRRRRSLPEWPYNLYCMIHGRSEGVVRGQVETLTRELGLESYPREILFSQRCFKQRGALYVSGAGSSVSAIRGEVHAD